MLDIKHTLIYTFLLILFLNIQHTRVESAKILTIFPQISQSHYIALENLLKNLAHRGHNVIITDIFFN